jgi:hypothetical protein
MMMDLKLEFTDKEIRPCTGITLMKKILEGMGIDDIISKLLLDALSNCGYNHKQLIKNFWIGIWYGASHF